MKIIFLSLFILVAVPVEASYWVVDDIAPKKGYVTDLTEQEKITLGSSRYTDIPESFFIAKDSKKCFAKFTRLIQELKEFDQKYFTSFRASTTVERRDQLIEREKKNAESCLKKAKIDFTESKKDSENMTSLEKRVASLEEQIKKIIQALKSQGVSI